MLFKNLKVEPVNDIKEAGKMKKLRILIIEDDSRQIAWAKECLKEHELTFAESEQEFKRLIFKKGWDESNNEVTRIELPFDFVITDLELPIEKGRLTSVHIGKGIFELLVHFTKLREGRTGMIRGCALCSCFEHHIAAGKESRTEMFIIESTWSYWQNGHVNHLVGSLDSCSDVANIISVIGRPLMFYHHFVNRDGDILTKEEVEEKFSDSDRHSNPLSVAVTEGGYTPLKLYSEIIANLIDWGK